MAGERSLAVKVAYLGTAEPGDGVPGTTFKQYPIIEEGSVTLNFNDPTSVDFRAEGMDDPWESFDKAGDADSIDFNIPSPTAQEIADFCGGTVVGDKWEAPVSMPNIRKSLKIQTAEYKGRYTEYIFAICKISAKFNQFPGAEQTDLLQVRVTKLAAVAADGTINSPWSREVKDVTP